MILNQKYEEREYPNTICSLEGEAIENVVKYRYLGSEIKNDEPNTGQTELELRTDVAECKYYSLSRNLFNMSVNIKTRTKILNSLVRSRLLYSCQTWCCTKAQMSRINSTYLSFLRKMIKGDTVEKKTPGHMYSPTMTYCKWLKLKILFLLLEGNEQVLSRK